MKPEFLVDNSAWNRLKYEPVSTRLRPLADSNRIATCGVIEMEALYSARNANEYEKLRTVRNSIFTYVETEEDDWQEALAIQRNHATNGQLRGTKIPDLIMAAVAIRNGLTILHYDKDFEQIAGLVDLKQEWVVPRGTVP